jgi:cytochrome c biogenesis protein
VLYDQKGQIFSSMRPNQPQEVNGVRLTIKEVVGATGLQIKVDPSIPIVYGGFGLLMLSVMASYISHSQVWALAGEGKMIIGGKTNRALVQFAEEMQSILPQR